MNILDLSCLYKLYQSKNVKCGIESLTCSNNDYLINVYEDDILAVVNKNDPNDYYYTRVGGIDMINELFEYIGESKRIDIFNQLIL